MFWDQFCYLLLFSNSNSLSSSMWSFSIVNFQMNPIFKTQFQSFNPNLPLQFQPNFSFVFWIPLLFFYPQLLPFMSWYLIPSVKRVPLRIFTKKEENVCSFFFSLFSFDVLETMCKSNFHVNCEKSRQKKKNNRLHQFHTVIVWKASNYKRYFH